MRRKGAGTRLHEGLVGERSLVGAPYMADPELRRAYETDLAPRTRAALGKILSGVVPPGAPIRRVLDLGAGTGAAGAEIRARFGQIELTSVDRVGGPGILVADVVGRSRPAGVRGHFDLIVAAHLLNELDGLSVFDRAALVAGWCDDLLDQNGWCVIIEPALRETSRALLGVRDRLLERGFFVVAPCFWQGPCPALARDRDWCHSAAPAVVEGRSRVDFSYLVLRHSGTPATDQTLFRVVSDRLEEKGRQRIFGCGPAGRESIVRLDRDRTEENAPFDRLERGDTVTISEATRTGEGLRIPPQALVRRSGKGSGSGG